jgi:Uma2 family endonuclease
MNVKSTIMTYKEIQAEYKRPYQKPVIQNCWIADVKRLNIDVFQYL